MNDYLRTAIVAPMTTGSHPAPFRIPIRHARKDGLILLDQIRAVDKARLIKKSGVIATDTLKYVLATLGEIFDE